MTEWVLAAIFALLPSANPYAAEELADAIAEAAGDDQQEAAILVALSFWETGRTFDLDAVGDHGHSVSPFQLWSCPGSLCRLIAGDLRFAAHEALARVRGSLRRCRHVGDDNALAEYTSGKCQTNREARVRWHTAMRLLREVEP